MARESDIATCPCCGSGNIEVVRSNSKMLQYKDASWFTVQIRCHECWVSVYGADRFNEQEAFDDAVERWNRRERK